jgi:hypothetical protein
MLWPNEAYSQVVTEYDMYTYSVSSKGQGYQGFLRKRAGSSFGQKRAIWKGKNGKMENGQISLLLESIKCFPISFNTFKTL